jgi:hypothetical protein
MKTELIENSPALRYSKMSNLGICCSHCPSRTVVFETCPRRVKVTSFENSPAQQDSKMYKSEKIKDKSKKTKGKA